MQRPNHQEFTTQPSTSPKHLEGGGAEKTTILVIVGLADETSMMRTQVQVRLIMKKSICQDKFYKNKTILICGQVVSVLLGAFEGQTGGSFHLLMLCLKVILLMDV